MSVYQFWAKLNNGLDKSFADYKGEVLLIVNTASQCGFTPQYKACRSFMPGIATRVSRSLASPATSLAIRNPAATQRSRRFAKPTLP
jgi:glutathione peroxidase